MKYMVISDIHGGIDNLNKALDIYRKENCSKLLVLGDLFNYGIDYYKNDIIDKLNSMENDIIAVCGNSDNTDGLRFYMPTINEVELNNKDILLTHGHLFSEEYLSKTRADIIFVGHTHVSGIELINNKLFINPGSITKSRRGDNSFVIVDNNTVYIKNLNNEVLNKYNIY